eukprot:gnl/MRDRNA2_/MRDRNA2_268427_c0_seq1.p1 gnl/MRDRNA2_/MRDRNA2_268427_c0~~gnl/MRDRNA2_/MRDRNA2_268427_c0_seq1.p1  ORF type:complete len:268 (-),score=31.02 gnl/MRDRNA2_/MRDRNA2_268427_c0_seq1:113-844(-)
MSYPGIKQDGPVHSYDGPLPTLEPMLSNSSLQALVSSYLGNDVVLSGHVVLRHTEDLNLEDQYPSGYWHHDRCGHRLKAFIFLHDIHAQGSRATWIAKGSHNTLYYSYHDYDQSRFADDWVRENYDIVPLVGRRGGGFVFDTNAIHKGEVRGSGVRNVILLEFNSRAKASTIFEVEGRLPCPSSGLHQITLPFNSIQQEADCSLHALFKHHLHYFWITLAASQNHAWWKPEVIALTLCAKHLL